jgi:deoxyhypusine synthase
VLKIQQLVSVFLQLVTGIMNVLASAGSMEELEEKIQRLVQKITGQLLEWSLNEMDVRLAKDVDPGKYENKGIRSRTLVTTVGEIEIKRRYYRELETCN